LKRLYRPGLPFRTRQYLDRKQQEVNQGRDVHRSWKSARMSKTMGSIVKVLIAMVGERARCMFCHDSRGTTIEHFWPKSVYDTKVFLWYNLLLMCQGCQNSKGDRFELDPHGNPLLIDPTAEDPWDYLFFDSLTGNITARFDRITGAQHPKGIYTTDEKVIPLNIESVTLGRQRTKRNLRRAVSSFLANAEDGADILDAQVELQEAVKDNDDYGLAVWFFLKDGQDEAPFSLMRNKYNDIWNLIVLDLQDISN
jgi:uncharacterized protein (TIGR02646 family)